MCLALGIGGFAVQTQALQQFFSVGRYVNLCVNVSHYIFLTLLMIMVINTTRYLHKWCDYVNMCTCSHIQHALKHLYLHAPGTDGSLVWHMPLSPCFFLFVWADHGDSKHDHFINLVPWSLLLKGCLSTVVPSIRSKGHSTVKWGQVFCAQSGTFRGCGFCKISFLQWAGATPGVIVEAIGILIVLCSFSKGHTNQWDRKSVV